MEEEYYAKDKDILMIEAYNMGNNSNDESL